MAQVSNKKHLTKCEQNGIHLGQVSMCHFCAHSSFFEVKDTESKQKKAIMIRCLIAQEIEHVIIDCSNFERDPRLDEL
tara:strand:+ start:2903 stop:3136 length:234 start_codon:yes stop_codon:yes gene_type:complete